MFGRGGKIIVNVKPVSMGHSKGPVAASGCNSMRFVFRNGGEEEVKYQIFKFNLAPKFLIIFFILVL